MKISELRKIAEDSFENQIEIQKELIMKKNGIVYYNPEREKELEKKFKEYDKVFKQYAKFFEINVYDFLKYTNSYFRKNNTDMNIQVSLTDERTQTVEYFEETDSFKEYTFLFTIEDNKNRTSAPLFSIVTKDIFFIDPIMSYQNNIDEKNINLINKGLIKSQVCVVKNKYVDKIQDAVWYALSQNYKVHESRKIEEQKKEISELKAKTKELASRVKELNQNVKASEDNIKTRTDYLLF